ncbi:MAG: TIR domain-containing protein [Gammaproteobacteria bacterium]|nr:TIR domain-containing protein [Gammaproteobacteria bacterium]
MVEDANQSRAFQFGDWLVEPHVNRVRQGNEEKHLERKAMEVLAYLLERAGETVSSSELHKKIWVDRIVEESVVHQRISKIRRILGDDAHNPQYIENIPRHGYRTVATVAITPVTQATDPELIATLHARTPPFPAYTGDAPYVFVCYSHRDREQVYPELVRMRDVGVNVWYDEGITPGKAWTEELAKAINGCVRFLYFVSPLSVESRNCLNELEFALDGNKTLVAVHLEHTTLPEGLHLSIGRTQAIFKYELLPADYNRKLFVN